MRVGFAVVCLTALVAVPPARAEAESEGTSSSSSREVVPELNAYVKLSDRARLFLLADVSRTSPDDATNGEIGIHFDYSVPPLLRSDLREADWARDRYLWFRVGYRRIASIDDRDDGTRENRVLLEGTARFKLPHAVWLANRLRIDLRDANDKRSNRYRYRLGAEREFATAAGTPFVPYAQAEWFYDTRFSAWSRQRFQAGVEVELDTTWRIEPYYAYDKDTKPSRATVNRLGLVLKYYR
jgi:hypothetical protein